MTRNTLCCAVWLVLAAAMCAGADETAPSTQPSGVDPVADQIMHQASDFLAGLPAFMVHAEIWKDEVLPSGHKIQVTREIELEVRRPDHLFADARAHRKGRAIWYDGKTMTVFQRLPNIYATVEAPPTIDQLLDFAADNYGIDVPLQDVVVSDPYGSAMKYVTAGGYFGAEPVLGVPCRHIGFSTDTIDWQLWVAENPQPLPQKLVITYKTQDQSPQYTAIFTKWEIPVHSSDLVFQFIPPPGASKVNMESLRPEGKNK